MQMRKFILLFIFLGFLTLAARFTSRRTLGRQPDGAFLVATGQRIEPGTIAFAGRPMDIALHPGGAFFAVLNQRSVFLATKEGVLPGTLLPTQAGASYRGCQWSPDGARLFVSLSNGTLQHFMRMGHRLVPANRIVLAAPGEKRNPVPGGMTITRDGARLFVACANLGAVVEVDLMKNLRVREWPVQNIPFEVKLSADEKTLLVSNWAGREPDDDEEEADSGGVGILVDRRGIAASGTVSLIDRETGRRQDVTVGLHPAGLAVAGDRAWVANAGSDSISEISIPDARVVRTIPIRLGRHHRFGSMPNTLAVYGDRLYACLGGDNAVCEISLQKGRVMGYRPAGFFPVGIQLSADGQTAYVVNTKGNGSVQRALQHQPANAHDFQGTVSVLDLTANLARATGRVLANNGWFRPPFFWNPRLAVCRGAIKHVLYIIKENRTYDQVFGDMPEGNGDARLCGLGEEVTPNHHALAREFTLFDNAYASGTNSAEGHQWAMEGLANDYIERFYGGYSRSYPYDGGDAMAYSSGGFIWDAAARRGRTVRIYGEFCESPLAKITPMPKSWGRAWQDRQSGRNRIKVRAGTTVAGMRKFIHPRVICWPLIMSDQWRADEFIKEYKQFSEADRVPNLMILTLPSDHTEGTSPGYPKPRSMVADNDLALGRVVEAVSNSPQWKETCIFVMEDDAQAGWDHVDGHRTVCLVLSPYTRRGFVDSTLYTQTSILRSIELMLDLPPLTRFDALATPFMACFTDTPVPRPYAARANRVALDDLNPPLRTISGKERYWAQKSLSLDWSGVDTADWYWLNRIVWHSLYGVNTPYPGG
jgi:sugar lactone lactonase YvrE